MQQRHRGDSRLTEGVAVKMCMFVDSLYIISVTNGPVAIPRDGIRRTLGSHLP